MLTMIEPMQATFMSKQCPTGTKEAEELFQLAGDYHQGRKGIPYDPARAEHLYLEALEMGNAKAALNLAHLYLYRHDWGTRERFEDEKRVFQLYQKAADMGCPEGTYSVGAAYGNGWGVSKDPKKAKVLIKLAAEQGALMAMVEHGTILYNEGKQEEGIAWMEKSLALGNGDAAATLDLVYGWQGDAERCITALRKGCKLGSQSAILHLYTIYLLGSNGQEKDKEYARRLSKFCDTLDTREQAQPIPNFDELFPPKPILPFKE